MNADNLLENFTGSVNGSMIGQPDSILFIQTQDREGSELTRHFDAIGQVWASACRFEQAIRQIHQQQFTLVVCQWELLQSASETAAECNSLNQLLAATLPVIFTCKVQSAAVKFKTVQQRSFYCLRTSDAPSLFPAIAELANQVPGNSTLESKYQPVEAPARSWTVPAPHFQHLIIDPAAVNTSIHALS